MSEDFAEMNNTIIEEESFSIDSSIESLDDDDDDDDDDLRIIAPEVIMGDEGDFLHFGSDITVIFSSKRRPSAMPMG